MRTCWRSVCCTHDHLRVCVRLAPYSLASAVQPEGHPSTLCLSGLSRVRRWVAPEGYCMCLRPASLFSMLLCLGVELSCVRVGNVIIWRTNTKYTNNHWVAPKPWPPGYCMKKHHWKGSQCWDFFWSNPYVNGGNHKHSVEP